MTESSLPLPCQQSIFQLCIQTYAHLTYLNYQIRCIIVPDSFPRLKENLQGVTASTWELKSLFRYISLVDESCPWWVSELNGGYILPHCF